MKSKIATVYKEEKKVIYNKRFGVVFNGEDNLKPLITENVIDLSPTASQCADTYSSFIGGAGFEVDMDSFDISNSFWETETVNDLLDDVRESVSRHQGCFIIVGYNLNYEKDSYQVIPYELCRVGKEDSEGYRGKIMVSPNGWGRSLKKENVDSYNTYNPEPKVIQAQVDAVGGWENYKGQIFFFKVSKKYIYPVPLIDRALNFAEVEYNMGLYYKGTVARGFEDLTLIRHRAFTEEQDQRDFYSNIDKLSGVENASSKLVIQDDWDDEREKTGNFKFDTIKNEIQSDKYAHFESSSSNFIRKAYKIPPQLVDYVSGKLGNTSGEDLKKAQSIYNSTTAKDRKKIERLFKELFDNYKYDVNPSGNWTIKQYALLDDGTVEGGDDNEKGTKGASSEEEKLNKQAQATLRGSVGGVTAVLAIQNSVSTKITQRDSGITMLQEIFGYSEPVAEKILGTPKETDVQNGIVNE